MADMYPHMCRDGHQEIGHRDSEHEMCPLCRALADRDELLAFVRKHHDETNCVCRLNDAFATLGVHVPCTKCEAAALIAKAEGR